MGRPKAGEEKLRTHKMSLLVTREVRDGIEREAKKRKLSMADIAEEAFQLYFGKVAQ